MDQSYQAAADSILGKLWASHGDGDWHDHLSMDTWEWPQGVALYAMFKRYQATSSPALLKQLEAWYDRRIAMGLPPRNVNTTAPMLGMTLLYEETGREMYRSLIEAWGAWIMHDMPRTQEGGLQHITSDCTNSQQLWDDTLYMTCLFLYEAGAALAHPDWCQEAEYQFLLHIKYLHAQDTGLWYHGFCFQGRHHFGQAFWGRGNSWFTAAGIDLVERLPEGVVRRAVLMTWREQCEALVRLQDADTGLWHTLLDQADSYLETSASAAIAYGLLKGARLGLLKDDCRRAGEKACAGVLRQVSEDGTVQGVSYGTPMGDTKDFYRHIPIQPTAYGQGLTYLMLTEKLL